MHHLLAFLNYHSPRLLKGAQTYLRATQHVMLTINTRALYQIESNHTPLTG